MKKDKKGSIKYMKDSKKGITLVALVVTIIVLLILAGVTITILMGDNGIITKAQQAAESTNTAVEDELQGMTNLADKMNSILGGDTGGGHETADPTKNWDLSKVTKVPSDDGKTVPVPIGFTKSTVEGEGSVDTGFVIKQGSDGSATSGINEFVWVPVSDPSEMFGTDKDGNSLGKLYDFGTSTSPNNPPTAENWTETGGVMSWTASSGSGSYREPDIVTDYDGSDADSPSSFTAAIGNMTGTQFKAQLQQEFEDMRESVETYGGFYIGRYETGNLSQGTAVVQKNNTDINNKNWYEMYQKCKTVVEESETIKGTTSMIWGCQWDATLNWFLTSNDNEVVKYVTDSTGKGHYNSSEPMEAGTGSNDDYSVNQIYDMAGNVLDWTIEANSADSRVYRGGRYVDSGSSFPASRRYDGFPGISYSGNGCRLTLYVK